MSVPEDKNKQGAMFGADNPSKFPAGAGPIKPGPTPSTGPVPPNPNPLLGSTPGKPSTPAVPELKKAPDNTQAASAALKEQEKSVEEKTKEAEKVTREREERRKKQAEKDDKEAKELLVKVGDILAEHNNLESNIGLDSPYWSMLNRYRALQRKAL